MASVFMVEGSGFSVSGFQGLISAYESLRLPDLTVQIGCNCKPSTHSWVPLPLKVFIERETIRPDSA